VLEFDKSYGPLEKDTFKVLPSFDLQFAHPVNKRFGYVVTAAQSSQYYLQNRSVLGARFTSAGATVDNPYTTNMNTNFAPNRTDRTSGAIKFDYKPWDRNVISFGVQANAFKQQQASRGINYNVGNGTPGQWDEHNTIGAATGGTVGMGNSFQSRHQLTRAVTGSWIYTGRAWTTELAGSWSNSNNRVRDMAKGFFNSVSVNLPSVGRVNLRDIDHSRARFGAAEVFNTAGARIDELNLSNYNLTTVNSQPMNAQDTVKEVRGSVTRQLTLGNFPVAVKVGGSVNDLIRDIEYSTMSWTYLGPDGLPASGDEGMASFIDRNASGTSPGYGRPGPQWPDSFSIFDSWKNDPRAWTRTPGQEGDTVRNQAIRSPWLHEVITAGYAMVDGKFISNRLRVVGGVRYELTEDEGRGFKQDTSAIFQRDAQGNLIRVNGAFVRKPEAGVSGSAQEAGLMYSYRGNYGSRDYDFFFPSVHTTFNITENILLRAAFAKTMGRPNLSDIVPTLNVGDNATFDPSAPSGFPGFITASNSSLKPWTAKNYDYTIEYYLPSNGMVMFNFFKKDIRDFFGTLQRTADEALLNELGLSQDYIGYQYTTRVNVGDAMIKGWEAGFNFPLSNLTAWGPLAGLGEWPRHFTVMYNMTHLGLSGSRVSVSDWKRHVPRSRNVGVRFNFAKLSGNILLNHKGRMPRDTANQFPNAAEYIRARYQLDASVEYQLTKRFSVFMAARNLLNAPTQWEVAGPIAPQWSHLTNYEDYGAQYSLGLKGTF
jgi:TonB-dependent receptor